MSPPNPALSGYAAMLGARIDAADEGPPVLVLPYGDALCGNPGMFHGGVIAALLEEAAGAAIAIEAGGGRYRPINTTVEYLRPAGERPLMASARIIRAGRRLAHVTAILWQESEDKPVATASINFEAIGP